MPHAAGSAAVGCGRQHLLGLKHSARTHLCAHAGAVSDRLDNEHAHEQAAAAHAATATLSLTPHVLPQHMYKGKQAQNGMPGALALLRPLFIARGRCADGTAEPLALLRPFLAVIVDAEASGPITAAALVALRRLLTCPLLTLFHPVAVQDALHAVVSALTMCKFEATNPWHDQLVLCKILQTLDACLEGPAGRLLHDGDVCAIFQAVYRIGFDTQVVAELSGAPAVQILLPYACMARVCLHAA
jgi:hypothetical protein